MSNIPSAIVGTALAVALWRASGPARGEPATQCPVDGPKSVADSVAFLHEQLSEAQKERIRGYGEDDYSAALHMGLGMWVRNTLGLWWDCPLTRYFNARGVEHADSMSGAVLTRPPANTPMP